MARKSLLLALSLAIVLGIAALPSSARADGAANRPRPASRRQATKSTAEPGQDESFTDDESEAKQIEAQRTSFTAPVLDGPDTTRGGPRRPGRHPRAKALPPRGDKTTSNAEQRGKARPMNAASSVFTGLASLTVVLGLFFAVAWAMRRGMPAGAAALPRQAVEVLGRTALAGRQYAHLVRCGNKILLVYLAPDVAKTLTEITDPAEVDRLAGLCRQDQPTSANASLRRIFQQFGREKSAAGWFGRTIAPPSVDAREGADA
ncbi:MAG TPA: flagellar biosynthetic protein FliO [Pirellulales bacterium]|nr:flagellar biosynthetic protein FliO [Pirellulales bacterium]